MLCSIMFASRHCATHVYSQSDLYTLPCVCVSVKVIEQKRAYALE